MRTTGSIQLGNVSYFDRCTFEINEDNLLATNGLTFSEMVYLSGVRGVRFTGCTFANTTSTLVSKAINAHNAGITVEEYCPGPFYAMQCDCASPTRSSFTGFGTAIAFYTTGTQYAVSIDRADFSNNGTAIEVDGVNNASVLRSNFNLGGNSGYGLFIQNATGYKIQENNFHAGFPQSFWPGIYVYGSGVVENAVYKNNFTNLQTGIWVDGVNGSSNLTQPGLQFGCNRFANNGTGILVSPGALVRAKQGEFTKGADNDFDNMASGSTGIASSQQFNYFHSNQNNHIPPNWGAQSFYRVPGATANTCASTLCGVYVVLGPLGVPANPSSQYDDLLASYNSLNAQLADMAGNESLDGERTSDAAVGNATSRSSLEASISNISLRMNEISQKAVMDILRDSVLNLGELAGWYAKIPTLSADYSLVEAYYHKGDYTAADNALAAIPAKHELDAVQSGEYKNYGRIHALKNTLQQSDRYWDELTETEIEELVSIAEASNERSSTMAKGVLCFFYQICYEDELSGDADMAPKSLLSETPSSDSGNPAIQVFPNPVDDNLTVFIPELPEGGVIFQLFDAVGRGMLTQSITEHHSTINLSALSQGLYYYRILNDGISIGGGKVVKR